MTLIEQVIISLDAKEAFNKSQNSFFMKTLNRVRISGYFLMIKYLYFSLKGGISSHG